MTDLDAADDSADDEVASELSDDTGKTTAEPAADAGDGNPTTDERTAATPESVTARIETLESMGRTLDDRLTSLSNATPDAADMEEIRAVINYFGEKTDLLEESVTALDDTTEELQSTVGKVESTVDETAADLDTIVEQVDSLVAAHETVATQAEDTATKLTRLANAVVHTQRRLEPLERHVAAQNRLATITETANVHGVTDATCESCGEAVQLTLLGMPTCPHCAEPFRDIEPRSGFFRTSVLKVGDPPALDGEVSNDIADELTEAAAEDDR